MSSPKQKVALAIFESYLSIRKDNWGLIDQENNNLNIAQLGTTQQHKLGVITQMIKQIDSATSSIRWEKVVNKLHDFELEEQKTHDARYAITKMLVDPPLLLDVLRAARESILNATDQHPYTKDRFERSGDKLRTKQKNHELEIIRLKENIENHAQKDIDTQIERLTEVNKKLKALDTSKNHSATFFNKLNAHDPENTKRLGETCFNSFVVNAENGERKLDLVAKLLLNQAAEKSALRSNSHFRENPNTTAGRRRRLPRKRNQERTNNKDNDNNNNQLDRPPRRSERLRKRN